MKEKCLIINYANNWKAQERIHKSMGTGGKSISTRQMAAISQEHWRLLVRSPSGDARQERMVVPITGLKLHSKMRGKNDNAYVDIEDPLFD